MSKRLSRVALIALILLLFIAVFFLMRYVQNLLYSDVRINLTEVVTQNKDVVTSKLKVEVNNLDNVSKQLTDRLSQEGPADGNALKSAFLNYIMENPDPDLFIADGAGNACFTDGSSVSVAGRKYFRLALEGVQNISDKTISRITGEEMFAISVPMYFKNQIVGTVQKQYTPEEMYNLCSLSLFSDQGSMYIINSQGYILIGSEQEEYNKESDNYFRSLYQKGNQEASRELEQGIKNEQAGFMETTEDGERIFSAYTPVEEIHDWYLISSIPTSAVSPNANMVVKMFYVILCVVVGVLGVIMFVFLAYKNRQQANLRRIAFVDTVTGGNTFNKFTVDLQAALAANPEHPGYLMTFDVDNFKYVNNYYGFDVGDKILRHIYDKMAEQMKPGESLARISGDHFIVLLQEAAPERLNGMLKASMENDQGVMLYYTAGVYEIADPDESISLMVDKASAAAQVNKGMMRKEIAFYSVQFDEQMIESEQLKRSVEQALTNDEIVPFFQPKVNINTREIVGAEVLARWITREGRLRSPAEFIPLCEKTGLITELDMIIFEKTLAFLRMNLDEKVPCVPISINFSRLHLLDDGFFDKITRRIHQYNIPPELIEIELTESAIFDNHEIISEFTNQLHQYGLQISMDDFGSGYSSLNMLKDIPIDVLKIDRAFLEETSDSKKQRVILSAIAHMAKRLDIRVVVEGVETIENVNLMKEFGCYIAQGYYFAKPMDEESFGKIYKEGIL